MKIPFKILFFVIFVLISSCDYQPTGSNFIEVDSTFSAPNIIILLPEDKSTINIESNIKYGFKYKLDTDISRLQKVVFYLDTNIIFQSKNMEGYFNIQKKITELEKYYKLTMLVLSNSGTGSLADLVGAEGIISSAEWDIRIFQYEPFYPKQPTFQTVNGSLTISWDKYNNPNFKKYVVKKYLKDESGYETTRFSKEFTNINETSFDDIQYIGESAFYQITVYYNDGSYLKEIKFPLLEKTEEYPNFTISSESYSTFNLKWEKSKFYENIKGYFLTSKEKIVDITISDQSILKQSLVNLPLGVSDELRLVLLPKHINLSQGDILKNYNFPKNILRTGDSSFHYGQITIGEGKNLYHTESSSLYWYSYKLIKSSTDYPLGNTSINFSVPTSSDKLVYSSPSGKYIVFKNGSGISYFADAAFPNYKTITDIELHGKVIQYGFETISISDNGIIAATMTEPQNIKVYIYNTITQKLICSFKLNNYPYLTEISADGKYVAFYMTGANPKMPIYKINSNNAELVTDEISGINIAFDPLNKSRLYYYDIEKNQNYYYDCETKTAVKFGPANYAFTFIDFEKGHIILTKAQKEYEIRDMHNDFNKVYEYKTNYSSGFIKDNTIFFNQGAKCNY